MQTGLLSKYVDIYIFGVVLFKIMCGRLRFQSAADPNEPQFLGSLARNYYEQSKIDELVFEGIKEQIVPQSLSTFADIAYKCLHDDRHQRPTASEVVAQLKEAKEFQVSCILQNCTITYIFVHRMSKILGLSFHSNVYVNFFTL
ncbi:putative non-specific serine/threonine protein kinase [Helianthus anomalus]